MNVLHTRLARWTLIHLAIVSASIPFGLMAYLLSSFSGDLIFLGQREDALLVAFAACAWMEMLVFFVRSGGHVTAILACAIGIVVAGISFLVSLGNKEEEGAGMAVALVSGALTMYIFIAFLFSGSERLRSIIAWADHPNPSF